MRQYFYSKKITIWIFILFSHIDEAFTTRGCITILKEPKTKVCICTNYASGFTRIPDKFPDYVAELTIENQKINTIDSSQLRNFPYLTNFTFNNNQLSRIVPNSFVYVPKIVSLKLSANKLFLKESSLPRSSLIHLRSLRILDLSKNPIGFVPDYYFQSLKKLNILILSGARKGFFIEENGLYGLTNLQVLDLSSNHLTTLSDTFSHSFLNMQLQELYIYKNPWNCDCNLQWLKAWFTKHKTVKFSKDTRKEFSQSNNIDIMSDIQPKCSEPEKVRGKHFLSNSGDSASVTIMDFKCPPIIFTKDRTVEISKGKNLTLICDFHANPGGTVVWSKNGMIAQKHWPRVAWSISQGVKFKGSLNIVEVEDSDSGSWRCILTTSVGQVSATFTVKILSDQSNLDFKYVLKYVGIGAVTIILLLVVIGIIIYCIYGFQIQNNRRRKTSNYGKAIVNVDLGVNQSGKNYRIISPAGISVPLDNQQYNNDYCNPLQIGNKTSIIHPCIEQSTHSPFSHYLVNGSATVCPLHGEMAKNQSMHQSESNDKCIMSHDHCGPCPIHGNVLSYLTPTQSTVTTQVNDGINSELEPISAVYSPEEYIVRVSSYNPISSYLEDMKYLSSAPDSQSFSFSAAI